MINMLICATIFSTCHDINHRIVIIFTKRRINTYMMTTCRHALRDFFLIYTCALCKFFYTWTTLVFLFKSITFLINFIQGTNLIKRKSDYSTLLSNCLQNTLSNPPNCIRNKLKTTGFIKSFCSFNQSDITLIN